MSGCDCRCHHESACGQSPECFPGVQQPHTPLDKEERILVLNQSELNAMLTERLAQAEEAALQVARDAVYQADVRREDGLHTRDRIREAISDYATRDLRDRAEQDTPDQANT